MADARRVVLHAYDGECKKVPHAEIQEVLASQLLRLTLETNNARRSTRHFCGSLLAHELQKRLLRYSAAVRG